VEHADAGLVDGVRLLRAIDEVDGDRLANERKGDIVDDLSIS
jgi:hypothetical protein